MQIRYCDVDGYTLYTMETDDAASIIAAARASNRITFDHGVFEFDSIDLAHYYDDKSNLKPEIIICLRRV
jgi:hypothetical protein